MVEALLTQLERLSFRLQHWYMKPKITRERVGAHFAFFHPRPTGEIIMKKYQQRLKRSDPIGTKVLVTGVFDVLHSEHKKFLKAAKKQGDELWVGVETDVRVRQLKRPGRPINQLKVRMKNLKDFKIADKIFPLPAKFATPAAHRALIKRIRPNILAVSSHSPNLAAKRKIMDDLGGELRIVLPHNPKVSTTKILKSSQ